MTEIYRGRTTDADVLLCPRCNSSALADESAAAARCEACNWQGHRQELVTMRFKHEHDSDAALLHTMVTDMRNILAKDFGVTFGRFLQKWGFITEHVTAKELSQYVVGIAQATLTSILETRKKLEQEKHG